MRDISASAAAPLWAAVVALVLAIVALALYRFIQRSTQADQ
jgi:ABC-type polysaccharide transport system permease subunit